MERRDPSTRGSRLPAGNTMNRRTDPVQKGRALGPDELRIYSGPEQSRNGTITGSRLDHRLARRTWPRVPDLVAHRGELLVPPWGTSSPPTLPAASHATAWVDHAGERRESETQSYLDLAIMFIAPALEPQLRVEALRTTWTTAKNREQGLRVGALFHLLTPVQAICPVGGKGTRNGRRGRMCRVQAS